MDFIVGEYYIKMKFSKGNLKTLLLSLLALFFIYVVIVFLIKGAPKVVPPPPMEGLRGREGYKKKGSTTN